MERVELKVNGMSCAHCEKAVVNAMLDLGATSAAADKDSGWVVVEFDAAVTSLAAIKKELDEMGYN